MLDPRRLLALQLSLFLAISLSFLTVRPGYAAQTWLKPVVGSSLIASYRQSESEYTAGHRGIDYSVRFGQPVFATDSGSVHFVGKVVDRNLISISHSGNLLSAYEPVCSNLNFGEEVSAGDLIGQVCAGDENYQYHCQGLCLHFSARLRGEYLSPQQLMGELSPSVLLPWDESLLGAGVGV